MHDLHIDVLELVLVVVFKIAAGNIIVLVAQLEVAFSPGGAVLGTCSVVAVRKEHNEPVLDVPLSFTGADKLVDNNLGTVGEVTELSLPHRESVRVRLSVAQLVTEDAEL